MINADLSDAVLTAASLDDVDLSSAMLDRADFTAADLGGANLSFTKGKGLVFRNSCLRDTKWDGSSITQVVLDGADLRGADLGRSQVDIASALAAIVDDETVWPPAGAPSGTVRTLVATTAPCR